MKKAKEVKSIKKEIVVKTKPAMKVKEEVVAKKTIGRKSLWASDALHHRVKVMASKEGMQMILFVEKVMNLYEQEHHSGKRKKS